MQFPYTTHARYLGQRNVILTYHQMISLQGQNEDITFVNPAWVEPTKHKSYSPHLILEPNC